MLEKEEFKAVYEAHFDAIRSYVFYRCGDTDTTSDVAQDVFIRIWEKRCLLDSSRLTPLLYKMAADLYADDCRRRLHQADFEQHIMCADDAALSPEDERTFNELAEAYTKALSQMSDKQRAVFLMHREDGMKYAEIAACLQISVKTVEKHISTALGLLKKRLL